MMLLMRNKLFGNTIPRTSFLAIYQTLDDAHLWTLPKAKAKCRLHRDEVLHEWAIPVQTKAFMDGVDTLDIGAAKIEVATKESLLIYRKIYRGLSGAFLTINPRNIPSK
jgi:hypothetical protein